jgi:hypothetical protein
MQKDSAHIAGRAKSIDISWPGVTFWKCAFAVLLALVVLLHLPLWLRGIGDEAQGQVVEARIHRSRGARAVPSVMVVFTYPSNGKMQTATELYNPRKSAFKNWGPDDYAAANAFIANYPKGKTITVWVPRYVPWEASVVPAITSDGSRHIARWMATVLLVGVYMLGLVGGVVAVGAIRDTLRRRSRKTA